MPRRNKIVTHETVEAPREVQLRNGLSPYENPDKVAARKGLRWLQDHVEKDPHYHSVLDTRLSHLLKTGYKIVPAYSQVGGKLVITEEDKRLADFVQHVLDSLNGSFEADIIAMMTHISRGFSLSELNYQYIEQGKYAGKIGLESIRFKEQEFFSFKHDRYGRATITQVDPAYKEHETAKFVHLINGFNDENPYGEATSAICAFYVWLKENGAKFWSTFQERFGQPLSIVETPDNMTTEQQDVVNALVEDISTATALQVPKNMVLRFMEAQRSGEANYRGFFETCNNEISKAMLGSTLAVDTQKSASGSHALGSVHADVMGIKFSYDILTSQTPINKQIIKRLVDYNFSGVTKYPRFMWTAVNSSEFITFAQGIEALQRAGMKIPMEWAHEISHIPIAENGEEVLEPTNGGVAVKQPAGVDNKVKNSRDDETMGREVAVFASSGRVRANAMSVINEGIIMMGKEELARRWAEFAKKTAKDGRFDFQTISLFEEKELLGVYHQFMMISALRGLESAKIEVDGYKGKEVEYSYYYKPFKELLKEFKSRKVITKAEYDKLDAEMKQLSFTIAHEQSLRVLNKIKAQLDEVIAGKDSLPDFSEAVMALFTACGVTGNAAHLETVLRTNLQSQYTNSRMKVFSELEISEFPQLCIEIVDDDATRAHHRRLSGYTRAKSDPIWVWLRPPFEYNCRCTIRSVHKSEKRADSDWEPSKSDYDFTLSR